MIAELLAAIGIGTPKVQGPAFNGSNDTRLYRVYQERDGWYFEWHREDQSAGAVQGPFAVEWMAEDAYEEWAQRTHNLILVRVR